MQSTIHPPSSSTLMSLVLCMMIAIVGRLIPHPWNATPDLVLITLIGQRFSRAITLSFAFVAFFLSDALLAIMQHHPVMGLWSLFTYSAWGMIAWASYQPSTKHAHKPLTFIMSATLGFWLWTNIGAWVSSPYYSNDMAGLLQCLWLGLPFLKQAIVGNAIWALLLQGLIKLSPTFFTIGLERRHAHL